MGSPVRPVPSMDDDLAAIRRVKVPGVVAESTAAAPHPSSMDADLAALREPLGGAAGAAIEGVANGAMLGGGAYAGGLLDTLLQGSSYRGHFRDNLNKNIATERGNLSAYQQAHPVASAVGEIAGGALPAVAAEPLSIGSAVAKYGKLARVAGSVADGVLAGGASGAISANPGQIAQGAKRGAMVGGVLGAAVPAVAGAVSGARNTVRTLAGTGTEGRAVAKLAELAGQAKMTPDQIAAAGADAQATKTPAILGDLMGMPGRRAVQWVAGQPSGEGASLVSKLEDRMTGQYDRVLGRVQDAVGQPFQNMPQTSDALLNQRRQAAQPLYDAAYAKGPVMTPTLEKALQDPDFAKAIAKGRSLTAKRALTSDTPIAPATAASSEDLSRARAYGAQSGNTRLSLRDPMRTKVNPYRQDSPLHAEWEAGFRQKYDPAQVGSGLPDGVALTPQGDLLHTDAARAAAAQPASDAYAADRLVNETRPRADLPSGPMTDQEALYAKLLHLNGGDHEAAAAAMRQLGSKVPTPNAGAGAPFAGVEPVPIEVLDYAKRYLDNGIRRGFDAQSTFDHTTATATNGLLSKVLDEVDAQVPEYAKARAQYHSDSRMLDALDLGRQALTMHPDELAAATAGMSDPEREMVRAGFMDAFKQKAGSVADRNDLSKRVLTDPNARARFQAVAPDAMDALLKLRDQETGLAQTLNFAKGGSNTADKLMFAQAMNSGVRPSDLTVLPFSPHRTLIRLAGRFGQSIQSKANARLADELAPMLGTEPGTPAFQSVLDQLSAYGDPNAAQALTAGRRSLIARALALRAGQAGNQ